MGKTKIKINEVQYVYRVRRGMKTKTDYILYITIPRWVREKLNLKPGEVVSVTLRKKNGG